MLNETKEQLPKKTKVPAKVVEYRTQRSQFCCYRKEARHREIWQKNVCDLIFGSVIYFLYLKASRWKYTRLCVGSTFPMWYHTRYCCLVMCDNDNASAAGNGDGGSNVVGMANSMPNYIHNSFGEAYEPNCRCVCVNGVRCSVCTLHTYTRKRNVCVLLVHSYFHYSVLR